MKLLETKNLTLRFGGLTAVKSVDVEINDGELIGLIGPNGAGKTSFFNLLTGVYQPSEGEIFLNGENISFMKTHKIVALGMSRTFQNIRLFKQLTVLDNIRISLDQKKDYSTFDAMFRTKKFREYEYETIQKSLSLLKIFDLDEIADHRADSLSYGNQRKLEIARALACSPKLLLLDEPAAGMNPNETQELMKIIEKIKNEFNISVLLIEHDMDLVMGICERIYVLNFGEIIASGKPSEIQNNKEVIKAYLGD
ncbi:ABC transporter ATP-binding protein [Streptobacillus felis]|uniref:ABC transporter ATP-binding protein n=1 Tax=Streptobacillus felis TaxID=1384509 RepID=A0A7Z0PEM9_9FUSO|nr:ABC transporter ATP-binding protein [Streptobacillus felis]NYV27777.1 ABC transporter ATP-binding protein [Streptobacillus felis]